MNHLFVTTNRRLWQREQIYLEAVHLGGALSKNHPGQQEKQRVGDETVHGFSIQEQAGVDHLNQGRQLSV